MNKSLDNLALVVLAVGDFNVHPVIFPAAVIPVMPDDQHQ